MRAAVYEALEVGAGDRVLVDAVARRVGHVAVQIAAALGAEVVATPGPANHGFLRELGATEVIDYSVGPVSEQLSAPVDAVLDLIGGDALPHAPKQVRDSSRIASIIDAETVLGLDGHYVFVRPNRDGLDALVRLVDEGKLRVEIARTFPLDEIVDAHRLSGWPRAGQGRRHDRLTET